MFNTARQGNQGRPIWHRLVAIVALVGVLGFFSTNAGAAHAATTSSPTASPSANQASSQTPAQQAYAADKGQLSNEYVQRVLTGKETLAAFETHYRAFMVKWNLGNVSNLHKVLTQSAARLHSTSGKLTASQCATVNAPCTSPTGAAQFAEENWNWCGPATLATTVVENSFAWPGANTYNGVTMSYNPYVVSQPSNLATSDEYWLATNGVISGNTYSSGTSLGQMQTVVNYFANGHGGNYSQEFLTGSSANQIADFQGKVSSDIGTGWDVPTGIMIGPGSFSSMPGYPYQHGEIDHWVPVTFISSDHNTIYYSDPVYNAPGYSGWNVPAPYEHTSTSNIVWWASFFLW